MLKVSLRSCYFQVLTPSKLKCLLKCFTDIHDVHKEKWQKAKFCNLLYVVLLAWVLPSKLTQILWIKSYICVCFNGIMHIKSVATYFMYEFKSLHLCFQHCLMFFLHTHLIMLGCLVFLFCIATLLSFCSFPFFCYLIQSVCSSIYSHILSL